MSHDRNVKLFFIITLILLTNISIILLVLIKYQGYILGSKFVVCAVEHHCTADYCSLFWNFLWKKKKKGRAEIEDSNGRIKTTLTGEPSVGAPLYATAERCSFTRCVGPTDATRRRGRLRSRVWMQTAKALVSKYVRLKWDTLKSKPIVSKQVLLLLIQCRVGGYY